MRFSIGIISAERSVELIKKAHDAMSDLCDVTYLPYSSMSQLSDVYRQNASRFDGLLFSGRFPYSYILNHVGSVLKPHAYFELTDRDYYKALAGILFRFPGIDVSRILMDMPNIAIDFGGVFGGASPLFFDSVEGAQPRMESAYEITIQQSLRLWSEKRIDLIVTRFTNIAEPLGAAGIPFESLFPSVSSMLDVFGSLHGQIQSRKLLGSMTASGVVSWNKTDDDKKNADLLGSLEKFNERNGMSFVVRKNLEKFELTTSNETLMDITQGYTNCLMTHYLHGELGQSICVGWGLGGDIVSSQRNALRAFKESARNTRHCAYLVNDSGEQIGPMTDGKAMTLQGSPNAVTEELSRKMGISPSNLQKLINLRERRGISRFSSEDLAFYLNVTPRSASRILARLAEFGCASAAGRVFPNSKGRPYIIGCATNLCVKLDTKPRELPQYRSRKNQIRQNNVKR